MPKIDSYMQIHVQDLLTHHAPTLTRTLRAILKVTLRTHLRSNFAMLDLDIEVIFIILHRLILTKVDTTVHR